MAQTLREALAGTPSRPEKPPLPPVDKSTRKRLPVRARNVTGAWYLS